MDSSVVTSTTAQSGLMKTAFDVANISTKGKVKKIIVLDSQKVVTTTKRRLTPEMEGKYIVNLPKGTTAKTRRILAMMEEKSELFYFELFLNILFGIKNVEMSIFNLIFF